MARQLKMFWAAPPTSEPELLQRVRRIEGRTLGEIAAEHGVEAPQHLRRNKGFVGQLIEQALGATAGSRDVPDFEEIGVELKTLPVDDRGVPLETTFVSTIALSEMGQLSWPTSRVYKKLKRVLWVVVQGSRDVAVPARRVGASLLWTPTPDQEALLRRDWEMLAGMIGCGEVESISAHLGEALQVRPKGASSRAKRRAIDAEGELSVTMPRGFYLRSSFTAAILREHFRLPG